MKTDWSKATDEELRDGVALALGWKRWNGQYLGGCERSEYICKWVSPMGAKTIGPRLNGWKPFPDYPNDLNVCHDMEKTLSRSQLQMYCEKLGRQQYYWGLCDAKTRCIAFLETVS